MTHTLYFALEKPADSAEKPLIFDEKMVKYMKTLPPQFSVTFGNKRTMSVYNFPGRPVPYTHAALFSDEHRYIALSPADHSEVVSQIQAAAQSAGRTPEYYLNIFGLLRNKELYDPKSWIHREYMLCIRTEGTMVTVSFVLHRGKTPGTNFTEHALGFPFELGTNVKLSSGKVYHQYLNESGTQGVDYRLVRNGGGKKSISVDNALQSINSGGAGGAGGSGGAAGAGGLAGLGRIVGPGSSIQHRAVDPRAPFNALFNAAVWQFSPQALAASFPASSSAASAAAPAAPLAAPVAAAPAAPPAAQVAGPYAHLHALWSANVANLAQSALLSSAPALRLSAFAAVPARRKPAAAPAAPAAPPTRVLVQVAPVPIAAPPAAAPPTKVAASAAPAGPQSTVVVRAPPAVVPPPKAAAPPAPPPIMPPRSASYSGAILQPPPVMPVVNRPQTKQVASGGAAAPVPPADDDDSNFCEIVSVGGMPFVNIPAQAGAGGSGGNQVPVRPAQAGAGGKRKTPIIDLISDDDESGAPAAKRPRTGPP